MTFDTSVFPNPELLLHPPIPKPLHGVNPRTIRGQAWWDIQRRRAYARHDNCCWACAIPKRRARYHRWLEAHEVYSMDYPSGRVEFLGVCALCHACHNFIHRQRMEALLEVGKLSRVKYDDILARGKRFLSAAGSIEPPEYAGEVAPWCEWHLVLDGKRYDGRFADVAEWQAYYAWLNQNDYRDGEGTIERFRNERSKAND